MKRFAKLTVLTAAVMLVSATAFAQGTATSNNTVRANVLRNCTITAFTLDFGDYDPVGANAAADLDASTTLDVFCTKNTVMNVEMGDGNNVTAPLPGGLRQMANGAERLQYNLFTDAPRTTVWATGAANRLGGTSVSKNTAITLTVFGRVFQNQDVGEGVYTDTVVATVNF